MHTISHIHAEDKNDYRNKKTSKVSIKSAHLKQGKQDLPEMEQWSNVRYQLMLATTKKCKNILLY